MRYDELPADKAIIDFIQKFTRHPLYLTVKDAFVAHTANPDDKVETSVAVAFGKCKGTIFVFNEMEKIAKTKPEPTKTVPAKGVDPDLDEQ